MTPKSPVDTQRIDEVVLALLYLFDSDAMARQHEKGLVTNPVGKAKSLVFTEQGLEESQRLFERLFTR